MQNTMSDDTFDIPLFVRNFVYFSFIAMEVICEQ